MVRILLVEDNELNRDMLSRRLSRKGFEVLLAVDGAEALAMAQRHAPALILMDRNMPVVDGWEATRRLKADPLTAAIPVIGLSADAMEGHRDECLAAGCDDYETKPIDLPRLLAKMALQLQRCGITLESP